MVQFELLQPARMDLAQPPDVLVAQHKTGAAAGVQGRMGIRNTAKLVRKTAEQQLDIAFNVVKIDLPHGQPPLLGVGGPPGGTCDAVGLLDTGNGKLPVLYLGVAPEHPSKFKNANP